MWFKQYRDYPIDSPLIREKVESGLGITGCEMHDLNGWGTHLHHERLSRKSFWAKFIVYLFRN